MLADAGDNAIVTGTSVRVVVAVRALLVAFVACTCTT
jgi:hypothetical protein